MATPTLPDVPSFESLYQQHYACVYRRALALMHSPEEAEEVTQEAFLKAFRAYEQLRETDHLHAWLLRIVTNTAYDVLRRRRHHSVVSLDALPVELPDHIRPDLQEVCEQRDGLRTALLRLSPRQRQAVLLRMQGYHMRQIVALLDPTHTLAPIFVTRACRRLARVYRDVRAQP